MTLFVTRNFLEDMALIMFIAALAANLCRWLRQPLMVGYLISGIVVGPNVPGLYANPERIQSVSNLGPTKRALSSSGVCRTTCRSSASPRRTTQRRPRSTLRLTTRGNVTGTEIVLDGG